MRFRKRGVVFIATQDVSGNAPGNGKNSYTHTSTGETRHPHHNKTIQGAAPKREKIASSRLLQYIQHKHLKMADLGRNM
jgi:hypothetical protein